MKLAVSIYVDKQEEIRYPLAFIIRNLPYDIYLFGGDQNECNQLSELSHDNIKEVVNIDKKIFTSLDIAEAQNKCVDYLREMDYDYIIILQADTMITDDGLEKIKEMCTPEVTHLSRSLGVSHIRLYHTTYNTFYGCTILGKNCNTMFVNDGAYTEEHGAVFKHLDRVTFPDYALDLGYLAAVDYYRHIKAHSSLPGWNNHHISKMVQTYESGDIATFIEIALKYIKATMGLGALAECKEVKEYVNYYSLENDLANVVLKL